MATVSTAKITGLESLTSKLRAMSAAAAEENLRLAGTAGAVPVVNAAKGKAPKRTRTLARSIGSEVLESDREHVLIGIGTDLEYAAIQEFGGTVTPKERMFLTVPLTEAAKATGASGWGDALRPVMAEDGQSGVLVDEEGAAQYALVKQVTIPAQPYLRPALDENRAEAAREAGEVLRMLILKVVG